MNLVEKIRWYRQHHGIRALIVKAVAVLLRVNDRGLPGQSRAAMLENDTQNPHTRAKTPSVSATALLDATYPATAPFPVYSAPTLGPRLNLVTDSINIGALFGGVGTGIILAALLAQRRGARLRIVTRNEPADAAGIAPVLNCNGIDFDGNVEFAFCRVGDPDARIDVGEADTFLTTSWWTTASVLGSIPAARVDYLLQEDERMFYPHGDEWLRCSEVLAHRDLRFLINTELLFRHLVENGMPHLERQGRWFEPAFPGPLLQSRDAGHRTGKRRLFFYARPNNLRNLFYRGVEALETAVRSGIIDPELWEIVFVGKDVPKVVLAGSIEPTILPTMNWGDYGTFIRSVDLGFCLMATPHPSYPPLDLAAAGAAVLTNRFGLKQDLSGYSQNILMAGLSVPELVAGIESAVQLANDDASRARNRQSDGIPRSWTQNLRDVLDYLGLKRTCS